MQAKIELVPIPVTDVDRAKAFYVEKLGFHDDFDQWTQEGTRAVQLTPPGSACSIFLGVNVTDMAPGSLHGVLMVVDNAHNAYDELIARGVEASPVADLGWGLFTFFSDPDGNQWQVQELPKDNPDATTNTEDVN